LGLFVVRILGITSDNTAVAARAGGVPEAALAGGRTSNKKMAAMEGAMRPSLNHAARWVAQGVQGGRKSLQGLWLRSD
jgi:hypothetical protein